jgi:hypothetical protein
MNQHDLIDKYLDDFGSISPMEAFHDLGITKLATRISEMSRRGYKFIKTRESRKNRYGESVSFMRYRKVS